MSETCEALVVGGGPAGAVAALLLARAGWHVVIVEKASFPRRKVCGEFISATTWPLLQAIGIADALSPIAGPAVRRVAVFAGDSSIVSALPMADTGQDAAAGRALGREDLDLLLLAHAVRAGAQCRQPWRLIAFADDRDAARCTLAQCDSERTITIRARVVIAAHGSWECGPLPTQAFARESRRDDLLGFKARFDNALLPGDLMPLLAFPGGYGGLVHTSDGRVSLSCCVRRDALAAIRQRWPGRRAGDALRAHIESTCSGAASAIGGAALDGGWLAAGPMRTGIRTFGSGRIIAVGNAAAEAHPIVAEGISMAIQSAHLACAALLRTPDTTLSIDALARARKDYRAACRANFSRRIDAAAFFAHIFMRPATAAIAAGLLARVPRLLTLGAHWSGKDAVLRPMARRLAADLR